MITVISVLLSIGTIVIFKLLPSNYFIQYDKVMVVDNTVPTFSSYVTVYRDVSLEWNDLLFCGDTRIPLPEDHAEYDKGVYDGIGRSWTISFDKKAFIGQTCYIHWRAYPTLLGIKGRPDEGFTDTFILE